MRIFLTRKQFEKASGIQRAAVADETKIAIKVGIEKGIAAEIEARFKAEKEKQLTEQMEKDRLYQLGLSGAAADIQKAAVTDCGYDKKEPLLRGCTEAFVAGRPDNLTAFLTGYIGFKRIQKGMRTFLNSEAKWDLGYQDNVAKPILRLIEQSPDPLATAKDIIEKLPPVYRQAALDYSLITSCLNPPHSPLTTRALIEAGADVDAEDHAPVYLCVLNNLQDHGEILFAEGADFHTPLAKSVNDYPQKLAAFREKMAERQENSLGKARIIFSDGLSQSIKIPAPLRLKKTPQPESGS